MEGDLVIPGPSGLMTCLGSSCRWMLLLLLGDSCGGWRLCSTESRQHSERPWNSPQSWESGMGGMFNQDH